MEIAVVAVAIALWFISRALVQIGQQIERLADRAWLGLHKHEEKYEDD